MEMSIEELKEYMEKSAADRENRALMWVLFQSELEASGKDSEKIQEDYARLYEAMKGRSLQEMDEILDPVALLCADHEFEGFVRGMRMGVRMARELGF